MSSLMLSCRGRPWVSKRLSCKRANSDHARVGKSVIVGNAAARAIRKISSFVEGLSLRMMSLIQVVIQWAWRTVGNWVLNGGRGCC